MKTQFLLLPIACFQLLLSQALAQWNQFRGPNGTGLATELKLGNSISDQSILWKQAIPKGTSSPIVVNGRLYVTSFTEDIRTVHCYDVKDGSELWSTNVSKVRTEAATAPNGPATSSLACDGQRIVAFFPDVGLIALSMSGKQIWLKDLGPFSSMHGVCSSPILHKNVVVMSIDQLSDSFIVALDANTGQQQWKTERLLGVTGGYSTPAMLTLGTSDCLVSACPGELVLYDFKSGEKLASVEGLANAPVATPIVVDNRVYYNEPPGEPIPMAALGNADKNKDGVIELAEVAGSIGATRLIERIDRGFGDNDGKVTEAEWEKAFGTFLNRGGFTCVEFTKSADEVLSKIVWKYVKSTPYIPTALVLGDTAYFVNDGGILQAFDSLTGKMLQQSRLGEASGQYYASPVAGGTKLVLAGRDGKLTLVQAGRPFEVHSTYAFDEPIVAKPSIDNGYLFVRTNAYLYCLGES